MSPRRAVRPATNAEDHATAADDRGPDAPDQTRDDTDAGWGERPGETDRDRWLREQRPPHWG